MNEVFHTAYIITVANDRPKWRRATAPALVREIGIPVTVAQRWQQERRQMTPAGLRKKLRSQSN